MSDTLGHPLVILLAGTVLTGFLVPRFADRRQRRQKALDLDVALTETITESVTAFLMAIQFAAVGPPDQERLNQAYYDFMVVAAVVRAKLDTYHPDTGLADEWDRLASQLERFYALAGIHDEEDRATARASLLEQLVLPRTGAETPEWLAIKASLLGRMRTLGRRILELGRHTHL